MDRRSALKLIGSSVATIGSAGLAAAKPGSDPTPDTGFDPSSREETAEFVHNSFKYGEQKSDYEVSSLPSDLREDLTQQQKTAISEYLQSYAELKFEFDTPWSVSSASEDEVSTTSEYAEYSYTISTMISVPVSGGFYCCYRDEYDAYDFTHSLEWFYEDDEVQSGTATCDGDGNSYGIVNWVYEGRDAYNKELHPDGYYVKTFRQGRLPKKLLYMKYR